MTDIGKDSKVDIATLTAKILGAIAAGIVKQGAGILPEDMLGSISSILADKGVVILETGKEVLKKGKKIGEDVINTGKDVGEDVLEKGKDIGDEVSETLKGLFKKKEKE